MQMLNHTDYFVAIIQICHRVFQLGFETSESFIAPRPLYKVALTEGECALATPPYASPEHTHIIHAPIDALLAVKEDEHKPRAPFWCGDALRDHRFDKNAALGPLFPMTMPRLTLGGTEGGVPLLTFDDSTFARFLAARGATTLPVAVRVLNAQPICYAQELLGGARAPLLGSLLRARTDHDVTGTDFTTFLPVEEMAKFINTRLIDFYGSLRSFWDGNDHSEYRELTKAAALLDELIAHGAPGAWVNNPYNPTSMVQSMGDILGQGDMTPVRELPPMEWIDRFACLYERQIHYSDHPLRDAGDGMAPRERIKILARDVAQTILETDDGQWLSCRELSDVARAYLKTFADAQDGYGVPAPDRKPVLA